jgi:NAD(P)H dehydrogenase (quinone)
MHMIGITGANGQLGRLVLEALLKTVPATEIVALARDPSKLAEYAARGVHTRSADYNTPETLAAALVGVDKLLLISSSEIGRRVPQHRAVIAAAAQAGIKLLAYTSVLRADTSTLGLAQEHRETEALLKTSGIPYVLLRNGWYTENYAASIAPALQHGAFIGSAEDGRIASAARADYAAAAAQVLTTPGHAGKVYELAGDAAYTLADFAAEITRQSGKTVPYVNLPQADFEAALNNAGLPGPLSALLADSDAAAANGALFDDSHQLSALITRPTTPYQQTIAEALKH